MFRKSLSILLALVMVLSIFTVIPFSVFAQAVDFADLGVESTGNATFDRFINTYPWRDGDPWGVRGPEIAPYDFGSCGAYAADFTYYCYNTSPRDGSYFSSTSEIQAGDVIVLGNAGDGTGHWFVVLKRNGNSLYTAEGNVGGKVCIGWNYTIISSNGFSEDSRAMTEAIHHGSAPSEDITPKASTYYNGHKYEYYDSITTWKSAKEICEKKGGHLAYINSAEENAVVANLVTGSAEYIWLGGSDEGHEGSWYWINGDELSYHNWYTGEPNNGDGVEHFLQMIVVGGAKGKWNDAANDTSKVGGFICEYEPQKTLEYDNHKYEFYNIKTTWKEAKEECEKRGGHLAFISTSEENEALANLASASAQYVWIGGSDEGHEGSWYWINGDELSYHPWYSGEPNNSSSDGGSEDYLQMILVGGAKGYWNDAANNSDKVGGFICEYGPFRSIEYNNHKYELYNEKTTWKQAKDRCEKLGGHLAVINSAEENEALTNLASSLSYYVWIGGTDEGSEGNWHWVNGNYFTFTNWNSGEPNNSAEGGGSEDYLGLYVKNGKWNDATNDYKYISGFICEYEPETKAILGDVDSDEVVTILDATAIQRHLASLPTKEYDEKAADTDKDGEVTILDATAIQRHLASLPTQAQGIGEPIA